MRSHFLAVLLVSLLLSGCLRWHSSPPKDLPTHPAVEALIAECRTMYCPGAKELAAKVIQAGPETLPALESAWKWADDPDVMVWTQACVECLKRHVSLDQYQADLKRQMNQGDMRARTRAAVHLYFVGDQDAFEFILAKGLAEARQFNFNLDTMSQENLLEKRPKIPYLIKALNSVRPMIREDAFMSLRRPLEIPESYYLKHWDRLSPEEQRTFIEECNKRWEAKRQRFEEERCQGGTTGRATFYKYRYLLE